MQESEPMIELTGDAFELDSLEWWSAQSNSPLYTVVKDGGKYWLKSPRFGLHTDLVAVRAVAKELIPIIKGSAKVRDLAMQSIDVGSSIVVANKIHSVVELEAPNAGVMFWKEHAIYYMKSIAGVHEIGPDIQSNSLLKLIEDNIGIFELDAKMKKGLVLDSYLHQLEECVDDPYIYETFSHFVNEPSWLSLWNTYEMIKFDVDKNLEQTFTAEKCVIISNDWAELEELKSFTNTANNHLAEAKPRHSLAYSLNEEEKAKSPNPVKQQKHEKRKKQYEKDHPPMSLADASSLITRIFRGWCKWKAPNC
jgi:hypothetical protein